MNFTLRVHVTRNFTKSDEFHGKSVRILYEFHKASVQLANGGISVQLQWSISPFRRMFLPCPQICPYPVNVFVLLHGTCLLCMTVPMIHIRRCVVHIYIGIHAMCAAFDDSTATYITATTIPPFWLLQANYSSTILGIQYDDSVVIIHTIVQTSLTILTAPMRLNKSADTLLWFCGYLLRILRKSFDDSVEILWWFHRWSVDYSRWICGYCKVSCDMYRRCYLCNRIIVYSILYLLPTLLQVCDSSSNT